MKYLKKKCAITVFLLILFLLLFRRSCIIYMYILGVYDLILPYYAEISTSEALGLHPFISIVNMSIADVENMEKSIEQKFPCMNASFRFFRSPICTYLPEDDATSRRWLISKRLYKKEVFSLLRKLRSDTQFIDIGANLGIYTIPAAHLGHKVLAIEANRRTAQILRKSLLIAGTAHRVQLVNNGLTSRRAIMSVAANVSNKGSNYLMDYDQCKVKGCLKESVRTVTLNDLIPLVEERKAIIKVDIQGSEIDAFTPEAASKFFQEVDVSFIQMEWVMYTNRYHTIRSYAANDVDRWLAFFYDLNYTVHNIITQKKLGRNWMRWPFDILFKKNYKI